MKGLRKRSLKTLIAIVFLTVSSISYGQIFRAGITAGFVASDVYGADIVTDDDAWNDTDFNKAGFMVGGAVSTALSKKSTLRLELNYIQKGTMQPSDSTGKGFYKFTFNYVEVPVIYKRHLRFTGGKKDITGFEIYAGISAGKLVRNKAEGDNFYTYSNNDYLNKTDVSLLAGLGYNFSRHFNFSFRFSNGVIPVFKRNAVSPIYLTSTFNNGNSLVLHFILQVMFGKVKGTITTSDEIKID